MIHKTAEVSIKAKIGKNVKIWALSQVREGVVIGDNCIIGRNVYIDHDVKIGSNVKIQNNALVYFESIIEDNVFIGPAASLINDKYPRSTNPEGKLKKQSDWKVGKIIIKKGASVGAGAVILPNVEIGEYSLVGAGSVVTSSTSPFSKVAGNPARQSGFVCRFGHNILVPKSNKPNGRFYCIGCKKYYG